MNSLDTVQRAENQFHALSLVPNLRWRLSSDILQAEQNLKAKTSWNEETVKEFLILEN